MSIQAMKIVGDEMKTIWGFMVTMLILCLVEPPPVLAGRPLVTEDAGTVEKGTFELEAAFDFLREANRDKNYFPIAQLAYGLTERAELAVASAYVFKDIHDDGRVDGVTDSVAYLKYRFWDEGQDVPAFMLRPLVKIPTADDQKGLGSGETDFDLTAVFSKSLSGMNLHFNAGYTWIGEKGATDDLHLAFAGEYEVLKGLVAVGEVRYAHNFNSDRKDDPGNVLLGLQVPMGKVQWDGGVNIGLNSAAPKYFLTIGVTIKFP